MENQKHLFNLNTDVHYLNCAYKAPLLKAAEKACIEELVKERNPVNIVVDDFFDGAEEVRRLFGKLINCNPQNVAIIPSTSYGFGTVLSNIAAKHNGNAITLLDEFPGGYFSLKAWCERNNNSLKVISPDKKFGNIGKGWNANILEAIDQNTSVVLISSVHWMHGTKFDLKQIGEKCREVGAKFLVDGTQSVGAMPMDVVENKIDALICATYKWQFGPYSLALAFIGDDFNNGVPLEESWMNRSNAKNFSGLTDYDFNYSPKAGRYNVGESSNMILMPILIEGLKQVLDWSPTSIQNYCKNLTTPLFQYLQELNLEVEEEAFSSNHLFSINFSTQVDKLKLAENLKQNRVIVSVRGEVIRVATNVFNDKNDIDALVQSIESAKV